MWVGYEVNEVGWKILVDEVYWKSIFIDWSEWIVTELGVLIMLLAT